MFGRAVILLSGGIDSAVCLTLARRRCDNLIALTVDHGQRNRQELSAARQLADWSGASHLEVPLDFRAWNGVARADAGSYVPARNLVFLSIGVSVAEAADATAVYFGASASDRHFPDACADFVAAFRATASLATKAGRQGASIEVRAPLLPLSKVQVISAAVRLGVPLELTRSCYAENAPCQVCGACRLRAEAFSKAGHTDPALTRTLLG
jgi:7-cyano-7-deazaguanine synthase